MVPLFFLGLSDWEEGALSLRKSADILVNLLVKTLGPGAATLWFHQRFHYRL